MKNLAIVGLGGFGREVKMLIDQINFIQPKYNFIGYFDDNVNIQMSATHRFLGSITDLNFWPEDIDVVFAIGNPMIRKDLVSRISNGRITFPALIHPSCIIAEDCKIGHGAIICAGSIITVNVEIGDHVIINLMTTIGHDSRIESFVSIMPAVNVSGQVIVGEAAYLGTGSKILQGCSIGKNSTIGAGAVVINNIDDNITAVGVPAKAKN